MASIDACFQQKHNKQVRDPVFEHPQSFFLDETLVKCMEEYVESIRPTTKPAPCSDNDDKFEHMDLKVPRSVLDGCNDSFTTAEGSRKKASTKFFDVTGLMALICHHDQVLWDICRRKTALCACTHRDVLLACAPLVEAQSPLQYHLPAPS